MKENQRLTARITEMARPRMFVDEQVKGAFHTLRHLHEFERIASGTLMRDTITWRSPFGILGRIADPFVGRHLRQFVTRKQEALRQLAESDVVLPLRTATP